MIDYLLSAPSLALAVANSSIAPFYDVEAGWRRDLVIPDIQVWADSGDTFIVDPQTGEQVAIHSFLPGFWFSISQNERNPDLENSAYLILGADRDQALAGATPAEFIFVMGPGQDFSRFAGTHVSPLMAGAVYPFGSAA